MSFVIRTGQDADVPSVARVIVDSWRTSYRGIVPDAFLDNLSPQKREENLRRRMSEPGVVRLVADSPPAGVVGFITGGPERSGYPPFQAEVYAIYLLQAHQRQGIGTALIQRWAAITLESGLKSALLWTLMDNRRARAFYQRLGGRELHERTIQIGGASLKEIAYGWNDLNVLKNPASEC